VLVEFSANASNLHSACVRLATELAKLPEITDDPVHFDITPKGLEITIEGTSAPVRVEVQNSGVASIPFTVLAGVLHMLPYFGHKRSRNRFLPWEDARGHDRLSQPQYCLDQYMSQ